MATQKENNPQKTSASDDKTGGQALKTNAISIEELAKLFRINLTGIKTKAELDALKEELAERLTKLAGITVAFPECSDVLLSLIRPADAVIDPGTGKPKNEISIFFNEYFNIGRHNTLVPNEGQLGEIIDDTLLSYLQSVDQTWCLPAPFVRLNGNRRIFEETVLDPQTGDDVLTIYLVKRLFIADLVWLFYFDRMGIFKILGAILDDFAIRGKFPISNGSVNKTYQDDVMAIILEVMVRKTETGSSSTVRRRNISYRQCLGWVLDEGRKLQLDTFVNAPFSNLFHKFIQTSLEYYKDKRLATAITGFDANKVSVATLTSIKDTIDLLKRTFDQFKNGRNLSNTLSGIVWVIAAMGLIRLLGTTLGIPAGYTTADKFIPAAYDLLVLRKPGLSGEINRYDVHRDCAVYARDILLDLEVLAYQNTDELETWLDLVEDKIEGYRTAYRSLTGVDLGAAGTPTIEQQA